jgi:hypothetical protein
MSSNQTSQSKSSERSGSSFYIALAPWAAFTVLAQHSSLKLGAIAALGLSVLVAWPGLRAGKPKLLELGAIATFAAFVATAFLVDASVAHDVSRYARGIAAGALSLLAFGSLLFTPFTEQYAREQVPAAVWGSPRFKAVNRKLTAMWGLVFAAMVPFHIAAGVIDTTRTNLIFNWILPALLVMWGIKHSTGDDAKAVVGNGQLAA